MAPWMMEMSGEKGPAPDSRRSGEHQTGTPAQDTAGQDGLCETNPIVGSVKFEVNWTCETKPIVRRRDIAVFHDSIIPAFQSCADGAKRTQFASGRNGRNRCNRKELEKDRRNMGLQKRSQFLW